MAGIAEWGWPHSGTTYYHARPRLLSETLIAPAAPGPDAQNACASELITSHFDAG